MKVKNFILTAFAASMILVSCDKGSEESIGVDNANVRKSVSVTIANQKNVGPSSRAAVGGGLTSTTTGVAVANATDLCALFADASGKVLDVRKLSAVAAEDVSGTKYTFHILPTEVTQVAFTNNGNSAISGIIDLANTEANKTAIADKNVNLTAVSGALNTLATQNPSTGALNAILVYGVSSQFEYIGDDKHDNITYKYYDAGKVTVMPALARLEIYGFKCEDLNGTTEDEDGLLPKYSEITIGRIGLGNTPLAKVGDVAKDWGAGVTGENAWLAAKGWYIDEDVNLVLNSATTASTNVYAFNVAPGNVPQIILQVNDGERNTNVVGDNQASLVFPHYVKTKMIGGLTGTGLDAVGFKPGYIYQVNFVFNCDAIRPWTPREEICVDVTVNIPNWTVINNLKPEFD